MAVRVGNAIKELRIHLCQTAKSSAGVREYIQQNYVAMKKANPHFPILIRECKGIEPVIWARYEKGLEICQTVEKFSCEKVAETIRYMCHK